MKSKVLLFSNLIFLTVSSALLLETLFDFKVNEDAYFIEVNCILNQRGEYITKIIPLLLELFCWFFIPIWLVYFFLEGKDLKNSWTKQILVGVSIYTILIFITNTMVVFSLVGANTINPALAYPLFNILSIIQALFFQKHLKRVFFVLLI
jgi:hypothetical protein